VLHDWGDACPGSYPIFDVHLKAILTDLGLGQFGFDGGFDFGIAELALAVGNAEGAGEQRQPAAEKAKKKTCAFHTASVRRSERNSQEKMIRLLVFEHTSRDFALRQADGHLGIQWGIGSLLYDCAILVSNDGIAAFQDFERAKLREMRDQWIQPALCAREPQMNQLSRGGVRSL
jgi:hypothetical protein